MARYRYDVRRVVNAQLEDLLNARDEAGWEPINFDSERSPMGYLTATMKTQVVFRKPFSDPSEPPAPDRT